MINHEVFAFLTVADSGSFSRAAKELFISPVSVMNQINTLERSIGVKLFERTNQGVELTEAGRSFYQNAKDIVAASDLAMEQARQIAGIGQSVICIATSILRPCKPLIDLWTKENNEDLPFQIKIVTFEDDPASMSVMLKSLGTNIDCFVSPCDSVTWLKNYNILPLGVCKCCIAVSRKHRLARKKELTWSDLEGENLLLVKKEESSVLDRMRNEIKERHPTIQVIDIPNFYDMNVFNQCEQHGYIMEVPDMWSEVHPSVVTIPVAWDYELPYGVIYSKKTSKAFQNFLNVIGRFQDR